MNISFKSLVSVLVFVIGISASTSYESIEFLKAKNLTADYCYARSYAEVSFVVQNCTHIVLANFEVPARETLELKLRKNSVVLIEGTIKFAVAHWDGPLMHITGENIQVIGGTNHLIHGQGELYWDGQGGAGGVTKPQRVFSVKAEGGTFKNINIKNCPMFCVSIMGNDLTFSGFNIDNNDGFKNGRGKNTDGMGFSHSNNIVIENSKIVNQDDCVNVICSSNAVIRNVHCWGSHGLTISSGLSKTDRNNDVYNITYEDCSIGGSLVGIHVKTHPAGGHGTVNQVTYRNIEIKDVTKFGVEIQQDYPKGDGNSANNINIYNMNLINVTGSVKGSKAIGVRVSCGSGSCSDWNWSDVKITGSHKKDSCNFHPNGYKC
uniref:endo-polygalacturonase n=1 Tax=Phaedon cochleariae TaxID=80249 RepID=K4QDG3_PHACE|nr:glycoside hydrolase family 28 protein [Phaedon cochleariae]